MIICFLGGIGSGKTLSVVREIINKKQYTFTNFELKGISNYHRIEFNDIFKQIEKKSYDVNWEFWNKQVNKNKNFSIYLDEVHSLINARRSQTAMNILMSNWVAQIRKILSDSADNHLYIISQTLRKIDVNFRELLHLICVCRAYNIKGNIWIKQFWYDGLENYLNNNCRLKIAFLGNPYFKYYDTKRLVFGEEKKYI